MRRFCLTQFIFLLSFLGVVAQQQIDFLSEYDVLLRGVENKIVITRNGKLLKGNQYIVKQSGGSSRKTDSCLWVTAAAQGTTELIIREKNGKTIGSKTFYPMYIPTPYFYLGKLQGGASQRYALSSLDMVWADNRYPDLYLSNCSVSSFKLGLTIGNETRVFNCVGALMPDTVKYFLSHLKIPYQIAISNIRCQTSDYGQGNQSSLLFYSNTYSSFFYDYTMQIVDFGNYTTKSKELLDSVTEQTKSLTNELYYHDDLPLITETTCNMSNDTCSTTVFYVMNGRKELVVKYHFGADESERIQLFYKGVMVSDIGYKYGRQDGMFTIKYPNGTIMKEGIYKLDTLTTDASDSINNQEAAFKQNKNSYRSLRMGLWKYYLNGAMVKTETYLNNKLVEEIYLQEKR